MTNPGFDKIEDYRDVATLNEYKRIKSDGGNLSHFMHESAFGSRDNGRTPFQWDSIANAGFTTGNPWIGINKNYTWINAATEENDPHSVLNYFKKIVQLRKDNETLVYGKYGLLDKDNPDVYAYTRELNGNKFLVLLNFTGKPASYRINMDINNARLLIDNYATPSKENSLQPYEAAVYELK